MRRALMILAALALASLAYAAGTVVITTSTLSSAVLKVEIVWTSDGAGAVSGTSTGTIRGALFQVKFTPGTGGVAPDDNYDATLLDGDGVDLIAGQGTDLDQTVASIVQVDPPIYLDGDAVQLVIAAAGAANQGTAELWVRRE